MTNSKTEDGEQSKREEEKLKPCHGGMYVYRGPMSVERVNEIKNRYASEGWKLDTESPTLSFVSKCGRWFDCYDTASSQFYRLDGHWVVNLVQTREEK